MADILVATPISNVYERMQDQGDGTWAKVVATVGGSGTPTGSAGTPNAAVVSVQGITGGTQVPVSVIGRCANITVTPTISTSAYTANYNLGGLQTLSGAFDSAGSGILQSIRVTCKSVQTTGLRIYLFSSNPSNSTWTDRAAAAINSADVGKVIGPFNLSNPDSGLGTETTWCLDGIAAAISAGATTLYAIAQVTGAPTFASTTDCTFSYTILKD